MLMLDKERGLMCKLLMGFLGQPAQVESQSQRQIQIQRQRQGQIQGHWQMLREVHGWIPDGSHGSSGDWGPWSVNQKIFRQWWRFNGHEVENQPSKKWGEMSNCLRINIYRCCNLGGLTRCLAGVSEKVIDGDCSKLPPTQIMTSQNITSHFEMTVRLL